MPDWYSHCIYLILGLILFSGAVVSTCTGKARTRFSGGVYRAIEPRQFWWVVAMYYVGAVLFIGIFLSYHDIGRHSRLFLPAFCWKWISRPLRSSNDIAKHQSAQFA